MNDNESKEQAYHFNGSYTKENLDEILKELGKEFRKLNGNKMPAEIILVGGAAVVAGYGFRDRTSDIDAFIQASSAMNMAITRVAEKYDMPKDWMNQDFRKTDSYSPEIVLHSTPYKTFSNVMHVRTLPSAYIVAMKLASLRPYKYDFSDVIGIIKESGIEKKAVIDAVSDLYGGFDHLAKKDAARKLLDEIYESNDLEELYLRYRDDEVENFKILKGINDDYPELLNTDNVENILSAARKKLAAQKKDTGDPAQPSLPKSP
ncbi:MAG: hypothetical protein IK115_05800 [Lachnospiraceae bacterium]|nr:hypothetical protein [Lachnospiraceae bacterium]